MNKSVRRAVHGKYAARCAYCGKKIEYEDMQIDHIAPKGRGGTDEISNLNPACRRCNFYKSTLTMEKFRSRIKTLHERVMKNYTSKVAEDYGIITVKSWDGRFYFEKVEIESREAGQCLDEFT